jgi:predicted RND superfamily exporter protein
MGPPTAPVKKPWPLGTRLAIVACLFLSVVVAVPFLAQLKFEEDVTNWLPANDPQARLLNWHRLQFPAEETVLIAWDGSTLNDPRIEALATSLRVTTWAKRVITPGDIIASMTRSKVPADVARERLRGLLLGEANSDPGETPAGLIVTFDDIEEKVLRDYFAQVRTKAEAVSILPQSLHMGGGPIASAELDRRLVKTRWDFDAPWYRPDQKSPLILSVIVALVLAVGLLRRVRLTAVVLGVTLIATAVGVAMLPATGTSMNMVLTVLSPLLLVLTLSAAIHVANYWRFASMKTHDRSVAAAAARNMALWPCFLAAVTTAIGLASLLTSPLRPVRDFGLYSAIGVLIGLAAALLALPALLSLLPMGPVLPPGREASGWARLGRAVAKRGTAVAVLCMLLGVASCVGLRWFHTETRVISYFPAGASIIDDYDFLERHLAGITPIDVVVTFDPEARRKMPIADRIDLVRRVEQTIRSQPDVSGTLALPDFLPNVADLNIGQRAEYVKRRLPRLQKAIVEQTDPEVTRFTRLASMPFVDQALDVPVDAGDELWQINAQVQALAKVDYASLTGEIRRSAESVIGDVPGTGLLVTGTVPLFLRTQAAVLDSLIVSFAIAFVVIASVLMIVLRSFWAGLLTMLPNLLPVVVVFGAISWLGQSVDIGMMITASVALGIAVDGTLHLLTWYREGLAEGRSPIDAVAGALAHCGPAMWQTSGIIGFSLLMLAFSDLLLISRFGWLMASLIFAALLADLVFLPALLCSRVGGLLIGAPAKAGA